MLEHLDREEVLVFLKEAVRLIAPGGVIRLAVPDIRRKAEKYLNDGDADYFLSSTSMCVPRPRKIAERIRLLLVGTRHHQWMYDQTSLCRLLNNNGFVDAQGLKAGETTIANPEFLNLSERSDESIYVEARKQSLPL